METQGVWPETFDFFAQIPIVVEPVDAHLTEQCVAALIDPRSGNALTHSYLEMTRSRVYGILAGYEPE